MEVFNSKKLIRSKSGLRIVATNDEFKSPFVIEEPNWVPDREAPTCAHCLVKFGFTTRKHHCRRCGQIYCSACCETKLELRRMCFVDPVRICIKCAPPTKLENVFFERHLKLLLNGAVFKHKDMADSPSVFHLLHCKLSPDHRYLLFDGIKIAPVELGQISSLYVEKDSPEGQKCLAVEYNLGKTKKTIRLNLANGPQVERTGINWFTAIEEAFRLLNHEEKQDIIY